MKRDYNIFDEKIVGAHSKVYLQHVIAILKENDQNMQDEEAIKRYEVYLQDRENRNAKILKRVKEKGYYAQYMDELEEIIVSKLKREANDEQRKSIFTVLASFILLGTKHFKVFKDFSFPIFDDEWEYAIELGFYLAMPNVYLGESIPEFKMHLDECIPYIWFCLIFKHAMSELKSRDDVKNRSEELAELYTKNSKLKNTVDSLTLQLRNEKCRAERENTVATEQARRMAQEEEQAKSAKTIRKLRYALAQRDKKIAALTSQFSEHHVDGPECPQQEQFTQDIQAMDEFSQSSPSINVMLPEQGVAFVSKYAPLIKRVQGLHPDWTFVSSETMAHIDSSVKLVFIDSKHIGHSFVSKVRAQCSQNTEVVLLSKRNINCLEQEMLTRYKGISEKVSA